MIKETGVWLTGLPLSRRIAPHQTWQAVSALPAGFWLLAAATFLFNLGISVFLFLYNLLMLDLGFREKSLGAFASAMALGSLAGTIPMGILAQRLGLKRALATCLLVMGAAFEARAFIIWPPAQVAFSFCDGVVLCGWVVCLSPAVAGEVEELQRPLAFSILFSIAVASGSLGGVLGGNLPHWSQWLVRHYAGISLTAAAGKRITILIASMFTALAAWPVSQLRGQIRPRASGWLRRPSPFLVRFLIAFACWSAAIGAFNPFTNVFFSRYLGVATSNLGNFFAIAQLVQAGTVLLVPLLVRRAGLTGGLLIMQLMTATILGFLSRGHGILVEEIVYCLFMAAQHMTEPAIQNLLMNRVAPSQRSEASASSYLVASLAQAAAAALAGLAFADFNHMEVIGCIAGAIAAAALLFRWLCGPQPEPKQESLQPAVR